MHSSQRIYSGTCDKICHLVTNINIEFNQLSSKISSEYITMELKKKKETFMIYGILEIVLSRLHALAGSIFGLIKSFQTCADVHKNRSPYKHREKLRC